MRRLGWRSSWRNVYLPPVARRHVPIVTVPIFQTLDRLKDREIFVFVNKYFCDTKLVVEVPLMFHDTSSFRRLSIMNRLAKCGVSSANLLMLSSHSFPVSCKFRFISTASCSEVMFITEFRRKEIYTNSSFYVDYLLSADCVSKKSFVYGCRALTSMSTRMDTQV